MAFTGNTAIVDTHTSYGNIATKYPEKTETITVEDTETIVREYFADIPVMIQVARCESQFRHVLSDGSILRGRVDSRDTGVMQINTGYHAETAQELGLDLENIYDNMAYARNLYERQGLQPWSASRPCWGQTLALR